VLVPLVSFERVCFAYPNKEAEQVLTELSFTIQDGEWITIIGHNGSGKSTLAKLLNGLLLPTSGTVRVTGIDTKDQQQIWKIRQLVGMVFQNPDNQFVAPTVLDDVAFGLENLGVPREDMMSRIQAALAQVSMLDFTDYEPHRLSGGQKQRVAIAGILAMRPKAIVFDESTAMLDPIGRKEVMGVVQELHQKGFTIINITHFLEEALYSDRILVMEKGKIAMQGQPKEVFSHVRELKQIGLDVPFLVDLTDRLRKQGVPLTSTPWNEEQLVEFLWKLL
jgi:energy-coupling factor transport system ATP-binding protein